MTGEYDLKILPISHTHLSSLAELERICFSLPWSYEQLESELNNPLAVIFVGIVGQRVAGYIGLHNIRGEGYITNIAVFPEFRRLGIGSRLIARVIDYAMENKLEFITLEVRKSNLSAISVYKKHGFKAVGIRKSFYQKPSEDAVIMTLYLNQN